VVNLGKLAVPATVLVAWAVAGCNFGQSGIAPPRDRVFLPAGIVPDPEHALLYVVNSNSDLRFNAGTIAAVDLSRAQAALDKAAATPPEVCRKTRFSRTEDVAGDYCCRDLVDSNVLNCNDPQFIQADATVGLGSFGSAVKLQRYVRADGEVVRRLFVAVRAEPSVTFADVTVRDGIASIRCTGPRLGTEPQELGAFCDDHWRLRRPSGATAGELVLPEEPHVLAMDEALGALYVGHLTVSANNQVQGGGVSSIDICHPEAETSVRFAGLARTTFPTSSQAVAGLSPGDPADTSLRLFATARYSAAISGLTLRDPAALSSCGCDPATAGCAAAEERDLTLIPTESFFASTFLPHGSDVRGFLVAKDARTAFVLHSDDPSIASNPAAIAVLDRTRRSDGTVLNTPTGFLQVCSGPTDMQMHDAGRGDRIYVTCYDDGLIYVVDPVALVITAIIDAGAGPTSLVFSPFDGSLAYVASYANSHLSLIDLKPGSPTENHVVLRIGLPHGYGE